MTDDPGDFYPGLIVDWPDTYWEPTGDDSDPGSRLTLRPILHLAGVPMHVEAHAVVMNDGLQEGAHVWGQETIEGICQIYEPDGPFTTKQINGREYIIVAFPHVN